MTTDFSELGLHSQLVQAVTDLGYTTPTPIQSAVIPIMANWQDVIGQAQTGTGKTAAFALPILHNLIPNQNYVQALVLTPTRELALQVAEATTQYGRHLAVRVLAVYGGQPYNQQIWQLKKGVDVVVGTPGRLLDLIERGNLDLSRLSTVVLDEADEMLSMGFIEDIESILKQTPAHRQTALFSATLPSAIRHLAEQYMKEPQSVAVGTKQLAVAAIEQRYYLINAADRLAALTRLFEVEPITSALIFARTRLGTGELAGELTSRGFPAEALNGDLNQDAREQVLNRFRNHQLKVLVATDVAARGLDIDDISHVINYELPEDPEIYVHRIGRTARAGKTGVAISLLTPKEQWRLHKIEAYIKQKITLTPVPTTAEIEAHRENRLMEQLAIWLKRGRCRREQELVGQLVEQGYDPVEVAAAALKIARAEEKQRPIAPVSEVQPERERSASRSIRLSRPRYKGNEREEEGHASHEAGMVRLTLSTGKLNGIRANHIVGTLARHADIPGYSIGRIRIEDQHTLVDVPEEFVGQVLANTGNYRINKQVVTVKRA